MAGMGEARGRVPDSGCPGARKEGGLGDREIGSAEEAEIGDRKTEKWS